MSRIGRWLVLFASALLAPGSAAAQSDLPRSGPDNRPPDVFPPVAPGVEERRPQPAASPYGGLNNLGLGGLGVGGPGYSVDWLPSQSVTGQRADLGLVRQNLSLIAPVWAEGGDILLATANLRYSRVYTDALLPDTGRRFPRDLWNASIGLGYLRKFDNGWTGGLLVNVGSASDKPFNSFREMNATIAGLLRVPAWNEGDFWLFALFYSPGGLLNFPIPGIAYQWNYSDRFQLTIGIPSALTWKPTDDLTFTASYIPLTNVRAMLDYRFREGIHFFGGYETVNEAYFLADRADRFDRFLSFEQRVLGGVKFDILKNATLDFHAGYAFGRRFGEGRNQGAPLHDRVDVAPGGFLGAALRLKF